ncbi:regulator of chromosome condensation 1/beta-lactamase-inhibitor protein II [Gautieria morchelliformis]|nr:regulator of chromosome condensation 1/beta-lactamase-inhibitor protein II [Gautieria morchelliformis]
MPHLRILAAGSNAHGQLANGTSDDSHVFRPCAFAADAISAPTHQLQGDHVLSIACGANHTLLLVELEHPYGQSHKPARQLWGCGDGLKGQLGPSYRRSGSPSCSSSFFWRLDQTIMDAAGIDEDKYMLHAIAAAWESTFIVFRSKHEMLRESRDIVISMGNNDHGDLGVGLAPKELKYSHEPRRVALDEMLHTVYPDILSGFHVINLASGLHNVIATLQLFLRSREEQIVVGWGASRHGQLGIFPSQNHLSLDKTTRPSPFTPYPRILPMFQTNPGRRTTDPIVKSALGTHHSVFLHHSGRITGLGSSKKGQLTGLSDTPGMIKDVQCTWNGTYLRLQGGCGESKLGHTEWEIQATGGYDKGQLGLGPVTSTPGLGIVRFPFKPNTCRMVDMACGSEHVLVLLARINEQEPAETPEVWAWGWNEHGNFGLGHTTDVHLPILIWPLPGSDPLSSRVDSIWAGCGTSWIVETF